MGMDPAYSAGREDFDACLVCGEKCARHGGPAKFLFDDGSGKIPVADLAHIFLADQLPYLVRAQTDMDEASQDGDGCRAGTLRCDGVFHRDSQFQILWLGQPMRDDRRFKGDHGFSSLQAVTDLVGVNEVWGVGFHLDLIITSEADSGS